MRKRGGRRVPIFRGDHSFVKTDQSFVKGSYYRCTKCGVYIWTNKGMFISRIRTRRRSFGRFKL